ncbi:Hypothetical_protein [Hexamita inflata]|uniref:Hypothetical_protein n=1 Tax=Hexamita inflata TaxID=28002 RepID=A0AA86P3I5_9EUKA|nr:Hypothetical protein HINF_LOCUS18726 [Hexamita inflata]
MQDINFNEKKDEYTKLIRNIKQQIKYNTQKQKDTQQLKQILQLTLNSRAELIKDFESKSLSEDQLKKKNELRMKYQQIKQQQIEKSGDYAQKKYYHNKITKQQFKQKQETEPKQE